MYSGLVLIFLAYYKFITREKILEVEYIMYHPGQVKWQDLQEIS